jgi:hypothetical protein
VTLTPNEKQKITHAVHGHAVEVMNDEEEDDSE